MIHPSRRFLYGLLIAVPLAIVPSLFDERLAYGWAVFVLLALTAFAVDALLCLRPKNLEHEIAAPDTLFIGAPDEVEVTLSLRGNRRAATAEARLELSDDLLPQPDQSVAFNAAGVAKFRFALVPARRGKVAIEGLALRWMGPLRLVTRVSHRTLAHEIDVVPNMRAVRGAAVEFFANRQLLHGLKAERYMGEGTEFDALREHLPGHDHRAIDWKASARHQKLFSREYRAERNHQVVLAFDCGHLMREPLHDVPKLDLAINAGLLMALVSLKNGDRVGLFGFDSKVRTWCEPQAGVRGISALQHASAALDYCTDETNFTLGLTHLSTRLRRRSLVVVFTDFTDTVTAELMLENMGRMAKRHLVLFVSLRDEHLENVITARPETMLGLNQSVVAAELARDRQRVHLELSRRGVKTLESLASHLSTDLINRYLAMKRRELV